MHYHDKLEDADRRALVVIYYCLRRESKYGLTRSTRALAARSQRDRDNQDPQWPHTEPLASASRSLLLSVAITWYAARKDCAMRNQITVLLLLLFSCTLYMSSFPR
jgi:hypothetical protein